MCPYGPIWQYRVKYPVAVCWGIFRLRVKLNLYFDGCFDQNNERKYLI